MSRREEQFTFRWKINVKKKWDDELKIELDFLLEKVFDKQSGKI